jgi:hypothetical protein
MIGHEMLEGQFLVFWPQDVMAWVIGCRDKDANATLQTDKFNGSCNCEAAISKAATKLQWN